MAYQKKKRQNNRSLEKRFNYHVKRSFAPRKHGLKIGDPKHSYSSGFVDAFSNDDENYYSEIKAEYGKRSAKSYSLGFSRARKAQKEYSKKMGRPFHTEDY